MDKKKFEAASELLQKMYNQTSIADDKVKLGDLIIAAESGSFGLIMLLFSLLVILPLPTISSFIGLPILFIAAQMVMGLKSIWLPNWIKKISIKRTNIALLIEKSSPYLRKFEKLTKPRWNFMLSEKGLKTIGLTIFVLAFIILLPLPFTNFLQGSGIIVISFGLINKDGFLIVLGILGGIASAIVFTIFILLGKEFLIQLFS